MTWEELFNKLDSFETLEDNWDTYGGVPITSHSIESARLFMNFLKMQNTNPSGLFICPTPGGGIGLENSLFSFYVDREGSIFVGSIIDTLKDLGL